MRLAALFSGGKDSTFAIFLAKSAGHTIECLITIRPASDESLLFHYPNSEMTQHLSKAMQIPLVTVPLQDRTQIISREDIQDQNSNSGSNGMSDRDKEVMAIDEALSRAKTIYDIEGIVHGGIASNFQKKAFEAVCKKYSLHTLAPLWGADQQRYMRELVDNNFTVMIVGVSAMGLEKEWLGRIIDKDHLARLSELSKKCGFNLAFEGGEAETLVIDCPLYSKRLDIKRSNVKWDGQRGIFEILEAELIDKDV